MKMIKDYFRSRPEEKDPHQEQWQDGEKPIITSAQVEPQETDKQIIERLEARIDELEERVKYLESEVLPDED